MRSCRFELWPNFSDADANFEVLAFRVVAPDTQAKWVREVDGVAVGIAVEVEPAREPDRVFLGALDRLEGPSYFAALQVG